METVLFGVSAGVIGLDAEGRINLPNRSASEFLSVDIDARMGDRLIDVVPEFAGLLAEARRLPDRMAQAQISMRRDGRIRMLLVRIVADRTAESDGDARKTDGFVVTIDDVIDDDAQSERTVTFGRDDVGDCLALVFGIDDDIEVVEAPA